MNYFKSSGKQEEFLVKLKKAVEGANTSSEQRLLKRLSSNDKPEDRTFGGFFQTRLKMEISYNTDSVPKESYALAAWLVSTMNKGLYSLYKL